MVFKQFSGSEKAPDGSLYVTITDGANNLLPNPGNSALITLSTSQATLGLTLGTINLRIFVLRP